jgi:hypothetical protein
MNFLKWNRLLLAVLLVGATGYSGSSVLAQIGVCAIPTGPLLPDLIVDPVPMKTEIYLSEEKFQSKNDCSLIEECVSKPGKHVVLRFTSSTPNIGQAALHIGDPTLCLGTLFGHFSECHQHYHFEQYADYRLWTPEGYQKWVASRNLALPTNVGVNAMLLLNAQATGELVVGRKQGFCLMDSRQYTGTAGPAVYQSCMTNQGLSVGWADVYGAGLPCQFVQVTDLPNGEYVLENQVNAEHLFPESDYTNNATAVKLNLQIRGGGNDKPTLQVLEP